MFKIGMMFPTGNVSPSLWKMSPRKCRLIVMPAKLPACRPLTVTMVTSLRIANKMDKCTALVSLDTLALAIIVDGLLQSDSSQFPKIFRSLKSKWPPGVFASFRFVVFSTASDWYFMLYHFCGEFPTATCFDADALCQRFWSVPTSFFTSSFKEKFCLLPSIC